MDARAVVSGDHLLAGNGRCAFNCLQNCETMRESRGGNENGRGVGMVVKPVLELSVRWYTVVYILDVYMECLPRVS